MAYTRRFKGDFATINQDQLQSALDQLTANPVAITAALTITPANAAQYDGKTLVFASALTITLSAGLPSSFGFAAQPPASGNASIAAGAGVTLNGAGTTLTRAAANIAFSVVGAGLNTYLVTGT